MKETAIRHVAAAGVVGAGIFAADQLLTLGLFVVGAVLFIAGIVLARRGDNTPPDAAAVE